MRYAIAAVILATAAMPARAQTDWGAKILKACTSIKAETCLLKPETRICAPQSHRCWYIGIDNYVAVRRVMGSRVLVDTMAGPATAPLSAIVAHID